MTETNLRIRRALISVSDKSNLAQLGQSLTKLGIELLSSGGTHKALREAGVAVEKVSDFTQAPEILGGRVKTLHPKIHGGILADKHNAQHMSDLETHDIPPLDLVIVNLYPFEDAVETKPDDLPHAIENIDIGGPAMIRAAAKNFKSVAVITDPSQYDDLIAELEKGKGNVSLRARQLWALEAFTKTNAYDGEIAMYLSEKFQAEHNDQAIEQNVSGLRYGENPHQAARFDIDSDPDRDFYEVLSGKKLSYNNLLDVDAAFRLIQDFNQGPTAAIFKHLNPCGIGCAEDIAKAYDHALTGDPVSAFGGIVILNRPLDEALAKIILETFTEILIVPSLSESALAVTQTKKNLRVITFDASRVADALGLWESRTCLNGVLQQERDTQVDILTHDMEVTGLPVKTPSWEAAELAWKACKHLKSNAIVIAHPNGTCGMGAGQMNRVASTRIALSAAETFPGPRALASDGFFPFRDSIDQLKEQNIDIVVQPGGSIRDAEVIQACKEAGIPMILTGQRHFRH